MAVERLALDAPPGRSPDIRKLLVLARVATVILATVILGWLTWQSYSSNKMRRDLDAHSEQLQQAETRLDTQMQRIEQNSADIRREGEINAKQSTSIEKLEQQIAILERQSREQLQEQQRVRGELTKLEGFEELAGHVRELELAREDDQARIGQLSRKLDRLLNERGNAEARLRAIEEQLGLSAEP